MKKNKLAGILLCALTLTLAHGIPAHAATLEEDVNSYLTTTEGKAITSVHSGSYTSSVNHSTNIVTITYFDGYQTTFKFSNNIEKKQNMTSAWDKYANGEVGHALLSEHKDAGGASLDYSININTANDTISVIYTDSYKMLFAVIEGTVTNISNTNYVKVNGYDVPRYIVESDDSGLNAREKYMKYYGDPKEFDTIMTAGNGTKFSKIDSNGNAVTMSSDRNTNSWHNGKYYNQEGYNVTGWQHIEDCWFHFDEEGNVQVGWQKINNNWYLLDQTSGEMKLGWNLSNGSWYFLNQNSGKMQTGWLYNNGKWYFLNPNSGAMQTGWNKIGKNWFYLDNSGAMKTGWVCTGGAWYNLDKDNGNMRTGWLLENGKWYFLKSDGSLMMSDFKVDGKYYKVDSSGACKW